MCIAQLSLPYRPVLPLAYPPPYRPALQPFCRPALLSMLYRPGRTVRSPTAILYRHATPCFMAWPSFNPPPPFRVARKSARIGNIQARHVTTKTWPIWKSGLVPPSMNKQFRSSPYEFLARAILAGWNYVPRVRSFSRPEKLPLKIHTGSSGTIYSYWVEKALLFPNWSSFSRHMPSPYVSNSCGFSLHLGGGGGLKGRYGQAIGIDRGKTSPGRQGSPPG